MAAVCLRTARRRQKKRRLLLLAGAAWLLIVRRRRETTRTIWTKEWLLRRDEMGAYETLLSELREEDQSSFLNFLRMTPNLFDDLLMKVTPYIQREDTCFRKAISPGMRLAITMRYLATGETFKSLAYLFRVGNNTIGTIVPETCKAIHTVLKEQYFQLIDVKSKSGIQPLLYAVELGHHDVCKVLLSLGADPNAQERDSPKRTALHCALRNQFTDIFSLLIKHGARPDKPDFQGRSVVHKASTDLDPTYLQTICMNCPDMAAIETPNEEGATPLMLACQQELMDHVQPLIERKVNVLAQDNTGKTALHYCVENRHPDIAKLVMESDPSILNIRDAEGYTALHLAVIAGNSSMITSLLDAGADVHATDQEGHTAVHWATVCGHLDFIDLLESHGANLSVPDNHHAYPIHYSAQICGTENEGADLKVGLKMLNKLIHKKVPINCEDQDLRQPLLWAASSGSAEACETLIKAGASAEAADKDGLKALHCAASRGHTRCAEVLLKKKAKVNSEDKNGCTPLFYAVTLGHTECAKILLKNKASPSHQDGRGRSPAHCAAAKGFKDGLGLLRTHKGSLLLQNAKGELPIHEACLAKQNETVEYLLDRLGDPVLINLGNSEGRTCLHIAALTNNLPLCETLVARGADKEALMKIKNKEMTPYDAAVFKGNIVCAEFIKPPEEEQKEEIQEKEEEPIISKEEDNKNEEKDETKKDNDEEEKDSKDPEVTKSSEDTEKSKDDKCEEREEHKENDEGEDNNMDKQGSSEESNSSDEEEASGGNEVDQKTSSSSKHEVTHETGSGDKSKHKGNRHKKPNDKNENKSKSAKGKENDRSSTKDTSSAKGKDAKKEGVSKNNKKPKSSSKKDSGKQSEKNKDDKPVKVSGKRDQNTPNNSTGSAGENSRKSSVTSNENISPQDASVDGKDASKDSAGKQGENPSKETNSQQETEEQGENPAMDEPNKKEVADSDRDRDEANGNLADDEDGEISKHEAKNKSSSAEGEGSKKQKEKEKATKVQNAGQKDANESKKPRKKSQKNKVAAAPPASHTQSAHWEDSPEPPKSRSASDGVDADEDDASKTTPHADRTDAVYSAPPARTPVEPVHKGEDSKKKKNKSRREEKHADIQQASSQYQPQPKEEAHGRGRPPDRRVRVKPKHKLKNEIQELVRIFNAKTLAMNEIHRTRKMTLYHSYRGGMSEKQLTHKLTEDYNKSSQEKTGEKFEHLSEWERYLQDVLAQAQADEKALASRQFADKDDDSDWEGDNYNSNPNQENEGKSNPEEKRHYPPCEHHVHHDRNAPKSARSSEHSQRSEERHSPHQTRQDKSKIGDSRGRKSREAEKLKLLKLAYEYPLPPDLLDQHLQAQDFTRSQSTPRSGGEKANSQKSGDTQKSDSLPKLNPSGHNQHTAQKSKSYSDSSGPTARNQKSKVDNQEAGSRPKTAFASIERGQKQQRINLDMRPSSVYAPVYPPRQPRQFLRFQKRSKSASLSKFYPLNNTHITKQNCFTKQDLDRNRQMEEYKKPVMGISGSVEELESVKGQDHLVPKEYWKDSLSDNDRKGSLHENDHDIKENDFYHDDDSLQERHTTEKEPVHRNVTEYKASTVQ